uniref:LNS2/PITP domain-containing protein n=1 Tax=Panagrolaimus sp. ES5 TaxID=591445 RepID=A0AC34F8H7_9BILA
MNIIHSVASNIKYYYNAINPASLTGAIDVIVVEQPDGSLCSTPFHVRFGKYGVFNSSEKYVDIMINNEEIKLKMKLGDNGVAYFVQETDATEVPEYLASSPIPGSPVPASPVASDTSMDDHFRKFKKQQREESRARFEKKRFPNSRSGSRTPSPQPKSVAPKLSDTTPTEPSTSLDQKAKMKLPFTSSIFSNRRNRSLPDLSTLGTGLNHISSEPSFSKGHTRKRTEGNIDSKAVQKAIADFPSPPQSPNRSLSMPKGKVTKKPGEKLDVNEPGTSSLRKPHEVKTEPSTPVKSVKFAPPSPRTSESTSDGSDSEDSVKTIEADGETKTDLPSSSSLDIIADGALSDSEVDKTRKSPEVHDDTVWKWGEFPQSKTAETKKEKESKAKASESYWSWFFGRSAPQPKGDEVYLDDLLNKEANPDQMEKYFGRSSKKSCSSTVSSADDSGNGKSDHGTPASPSAVSMDSLNTDQTEATPIPTPTHNEIKKAVEKKTAIELEMLAGTDQYDGEPTTKYAKKVKERQKSGNSTSDASIVSEEEPVPMAHTSYIQEEPVPMAHTSYIRSLRLSSDELKSLQLQYGSNEARFSVTTKFQGTSWCSCHIYLFKYSDRIVISDIDGTITKSDVLGHVIAAIGGQWAHAGVAELYSRIKQNGYKMVYLSSRAIGQSHYTKTYLQSLAQGSKSLPDGPVLLSPMSVLMAFRKEVIERKPEEFKIACLSDLKSLFPIKHPFYAGFGNRETDVRSYAAVDIPAERILIINPSGTVKRADAGGFSSSYSMMAMEMVDYLFPPLHLAPRRPSQDDDGNILKMEKMRANFTKPETCSTFTHWRSTSDTVLVEDEIAAYERKRKELADKNKKSAKTRKVARR